MDRKLMRYAFYQVDPSWRALPDEERALQKKEFAGLINNAPLEVHPYSTVGMRADSDLALWEVADDPKQIQQLQVFINGSALGRFLKTTYSYLAMTKKSMYLKGHKHAGQEFEMPAGPKGSPYLFVYPMDKLRPWYRLPFDERRRIMGEHFRIGHKYPEVVIHTGYSFGIDDQEFVVAFEASSPAEFLDLVQELRESESSSYTARDVPIFTCLRLPIEEILNQLDGSQ
ncbi:MAG: chlorite dismutase family protein [Actinomycetota bacterium]|nr:chlorite dismutase family protein [Actinomycetota bacterium]